MHPNYKDCTGLCHFGLVSIKAEGMPAHPDIYDNADDMSDEQYYRQLKAYRDEVTGDSVYVTYCSRPKLLEKLKNDVP